MTDAEVTCLELEHAPFVSLGLDLTAGTVGGMAQVIAGHPFDTIKVRLQTQPMSGGKFAGPLQCFRQTMQAEGFLGLYKGMASPLAGAGVVNAILFAAYGQAKSFFLRNAGAECGGELTITQSIAAGAFSGLVNCVVITPVELIKLRLQTQYDSSTKRTSRKSLAVPAAAGAVAEPVREYRGPIDVARQIAHKEGKSQLFRGMYGTILREIPAYGAYFGCYEGAKVLLAAEGESPNEIGAMKTFIAGGIGGIGCWLFSYPQDVIKNILQMERTSTGYRRFAFDGGFWDAGRQLYKREGMRGMWKGFVPCILRSFPANAATFLAYEVTLQLLQDYFL